MGEKDLKIKYKKSTIKTKEGKNIGNRQKSSPLKEKMKADYIRTKTRQTSEKTTSDASNQAEEAIEDTIVEAGIYMADRMVLVKGNKKDRQYKLNEELNNQENHAVETSKSEENKRDFKKKYAVKKVRKIKEKQYLKQENFCKESFLSQEQQKGEKRFAISEKYRNQKVIEAREVRKKQKELKARKIQNNKEKRYVEKTLKVRLFRQKTISEQKAVRQNGYRVRLANAITNTVTAFVKSILTALGSLSGLIIVFVIIGAILALVSTSFGVFFSVYDDTAGTRRIAEVVAETNSEFYAKVDGIEKRVSHDQVEYHIVPDGGNQLFITNWTEVVAVFAAKTAGVDENAMDVITMDDIRVCLLKDVFWDMNELSYKTEKVKYGEDRKTILHITLKSRTYEDMMDFYDFTNYQKQALSELMQSEYAQLFSELVGTLGVAGGNIELTPEQIQKILKNLPENLSPERRDVMGAAYSLIGKVNYFWGGKSEVIGWDSRWGTPMKVTSAGSSTTGMTLPFGLDCSGFVTWVFINATGDPSYADVIGHGARNQYGKCKKISWNEAQPGDLVFYPDLGHVGIIAGKDNNGELLVIHCASSQNNVVITGQQGFTRIGRPTVFY